jgi:hypothetical protein
MPALKSLRQRPDGMDSAGSWGSKPLPPEIPMMKFSRPFVHHNKAPQCIVIVRKFVSFQQIQKSRGLRLKMHRNGDCFMGAGA